MPIIAVSSIALAAWFALAAVVAAAAVLVFGVIRTGARRPHRPWIVVDLSTGDRPVLTINNPSPVEATEVTLNPADGSDAADHRGLTDTIPFRHPLPIVPPGATIRIAMNGVAPQATTNPVAVDVTYRGPDQASYRDTYLLDVGIPRPKPDSGNGQRRQPAGGNRRGLGRGLGDLLGVDDRPMVVVTIEESGDPDQAR
jgi:hypothetical protein